MQITFDKDSTERALRTGYHGIVALIGAVPTLILVSHQAGLDHNAFVATALGDMIVWTGVASKVINALEDRHLIPAFLKTPIVAVVPPEPTDGTGTDAPEEQVGPVTEEEHVSAGGVLADRAGNVQQPPAPEPAAATPAPTTPAA